MQLGLGLVPGDGAGYACRFVDCGRLDAERVGETNKKAEQRRDVCGLGDLLVSPADVTQALDLLVGDLISGPAYRFDELEELVLFRGEAGCVEVTVSECFGRPLELFALQLQEPRV
jgi:hypothetical protein